MSCCAACHFRDEEKRVWPYLDPRARKWLRAEHDRLRAAGYPRDEVLKHADQEMRVFRDQGVPARLLDVTADEHTEIVKNDAFH